MEKQTGTFGSFALGFLFGGLVGAAVAHLTAPQSGEETCEQPITGAGTRRMHDAASWVPETPVRIWWDAADAVPLAEEARESNEGESK